MSAFHEMHVSPTQHSYVWLPRKCDYRTDRQTDAGQNDPYVPQCFAGDTKTCITSYHCIPLPRSIKYLNVNFSVLLWNKDKDRLKPIIFWITAINMYSSAPYTASLSSELSWMWVSHCLIPYMYIRNFSCEFNFRWIRDLPEIAKNRHSEK